MAESRAKLSALVRGIMSAVQSASDIAGQQHFDLIANYFDCDETSGRLIPKVIRLSLPNGQTMDVPLICLINPASYHLSEMTVDMSLRLSPGEVKAAIEKGVDEAGASRQSYHVEMSHQGDKGAVKISMKFSADESEPEALSRLIEQLTNTYTTPTKTPDESLPVWFPSKGSPTGKMIRQGRSPSDTP